jgi:2'-5' RNA ligase
VHRLFFALWPDAATRARLAYAVAHLRAQHEQAGRWTRVERYHLTLQFLGDFASLPTQLIEAACSAAAQVRVAPFTLVLERAGSFRNRSIPWWLGCDEGSPHLRELWEQLGTALRDAQIRFDTHRAFAPHLTILRDAHALLPDTVIMPLPWSVHDFVLLQSLPRMGQAGYSVVRRFPLHA